MAKRKKKGVPRNKWQAHPNDAIRLAALRWFALEIERVSIQIYASNQNLYEDMEDVLRQTLLSMADVGKDAALGDGDCPEGYFLCRDGVCAPMCDGIIGSRDES
jgi:hypothetical protein